MDALYQMLCSLGLTGIFPTRGFIPAFLVCSLLKFGSYIPMIANTQIVKLAENATPTWFTNNWTFVVLMILAGLEIAANKVDEIREWMMEIDPYIKPTMAVITTFGMLNATDGEFIQSLVHEPQEASFFSSFIALIVGGITFFLTKVRYAIFDFIQSVDPEDDLSLQQTLSWIEDTWVFVLVVILMFLPLFVIIINLLFFILLWLIHQYLAKKEEQKRIECAQCHTLIYGCAIECPSCKTPNPRVKKIGLYGQTIQVLCSDLKKHELNLIIKKRCPKCATFLTQRTPVQVCPTCHHELFVQEEEYNSFMNHIKGRLIPTLLIGGIIGFIPILGSIVGLIICRIKLVSPFARYTPLSGRIMTKILLKLVTFIIIILQICFLGVFVIPLLILLNYCFWRNTFINNRITSLKKHLAKD